MRALVAFLVLCAATFAATAGSYGGGSAAMSVRALPSVGDYMVRYSEPGGFQSIEIVATPNIGGAPGDVWATGATTTRRQNEAGDWEEGGTYRVSNGRLQRLTPNGWRSLVRDPRHPDATGLFWTDEETVGTLPNASAAP